MDLPAIPLEHGWGVCIAALQAEISEVTAVDVYQFCRDVCSTRLINDGPTMLGGNGVVVQIDESLFVHKCKVCRKVIVLGGVMTIVIIKVHYIYGLLLPCNTASSGTPTQR